MRKFLTTGLFSAILGIVIGGAPADAALVSRGFLDEALENYATTTALDLKANQSDFTELSDKIGILPDGITVQAMYEGWTDSRGNYLPGLSNLSKSATLLLNAYNSEPALLLIQGSKATTIDGVDYTGPVYPLWKLSEGIDKIDSIETKIGTLPSGNFPEFPESENLFSSFGQPLTYPTSLEGLVTALYGDAETGTQGLLAALVAGYEHPSAHTGIGIFPASANAARALEQIGNIPDGKNLAGMIGTLPAGYDSVGAALTAIKGIAEEAKAAALAAIPDPKAEGSTGKFVLTVDIVGDNATYRWEKIDREGETTTTTE